MTMTAPSSTAQLDRTALRDVRRDVLVIDDEPAVAELLADVVGGAGLGVSTASTPAEIGVALTAEHDLVVLDLALGDLDGVTVMRSLAEHHPGAAVVLVSGFDTSVLESAARVAALHGLRVVASFVKPVDVMALRATVAEWATSSRQEQPERSAVEIDVDAVLYDGRLWLAYQPKCEMATGRVVGAEALLRWSHPVAGPVPANEVVAAVERAGRTTELLDVVARTAAVDRWAMPSLRALQDVAINVSAADLADERLPERLLHILGAAAPACGWTLEITETEPILETRASLSALTRFRLLGFQVAIDDYGHGLSNLERLLSVPFTQLKIDAAMVGLLASGASRDVAVVSGIIDLGHARGLSVVAEGVEAVGQLEDLRALGCDLVQGYLLGRPAPAGSFSSEALVAPWHYGAGVR